MTIDQSELQSDFSNIMIDWGQTSNTISAVYYSNYVSGSTRINSWINRTGSPFKVGMFLPLSAKFIATDPGRYAQCEGALYMPAGTYIMTADKVIYSGRMYEVENSIRHIDHVKVVLRAVEPVGPNLDGTGEVWTG